MSSALSTALVLALACGGIAVTIAKSKLFAGARVHADVRWPWLGALLYCPYCLAHWLVFAGAAVYQPRLIGSGPALLDVVVSAFAIITLACAVAAGLIQLYRGMFAP